MHGKASRIRVVGGRLFVGLPREFSAGRYHSLCAIRETLPSELVVTAESEDGVVMAIEHVRLPVAAVQFHPESILTLDDDIGLRLLHNVVITLAPPGRAGARASPAGGRA
jgi:anthranilate synthase